jgi:hypothetical protein
MTDKERLAFFEQVKGKPIRWSTWSEGQYFIPERLGEYRMIYGTHYYPTRTVRDTNWRVMKGFEPCDGYWCIDYKLLDSMEIDKALEEE